MTRTTQAQPPFGFARPVVPPLSQAVPSPAVREAPGAPAPDAYSPPEGEVLPLASIEPAPPEPRDPTSPFVSSAPPEPAAEWRPDQPLPTNTPAEQATAPEVDPATLPPPNGAAVVPVAAPPVAAMPVAPRYPAPTGYPSPGPQASPYPANPYATGPYSSPANQNAGGPYPYQPRPQAAPGRVSGGMRPAGGAQLALLLAGLIWSQVSIIALIAAAVVSLAGRTAGRVLVTLAAAFVLVLFVPWNYGYIGTDQWQSTAQLLSLVCLVGVALMSRQQLRRQQRP
ncbi:hypothetical protein GCM10009785_14120 [Brooklawnia cerclae]